MNVIITSISRISREACITAICQEIGGVHRITATLGFSGSDAWVEGEVSDGVVLPHG